MNLVMPERFTERQLQVMLAIANDYSTKEIANMLGISHKTCDSHRQGLYRKLKCNSAVGVTRYAISRGYVSCAMPGRPCLSDPNTRKLTDRQMQVIVLTASDLSCKQIAAELATAKVTVEQHKRRIYKKIGRLTPVGLTKYALTKGYVTLSKNLT
jgi:DNA-binding NarL/FixJ family response regulator